MIPEKKPSTDGLWKTLALIGVLASVASLVIAIINMFN